MAIYYYYLEIPMLIAGITLWIFCCYYVKRQREDTEGESLGFRDSPSVYVIPVYDEDVYEEDIYEARFGLAYRESSVYCPRNIGPPPPYRLEPPSYGDTPPSYSDLYRNSTGPLHHQHTSPLQ